VKDKGVNLNTLTTTFIKIILCDPLMITKLNFATCYGHAMSKHCQYGTNDIKVCGGIREFPSRMHNLLFVRLLLEQKSKKGRQEWAKTCRNPLFALGS
jgi:hypothetical protein